jgi:hypothetical protein
VTSQHKLIAGTVAVALLAGGGAALAAFELSASSSTAATPPAVTATFGDNDGVGSYGLGPGRLGGRGLGGGLGPGDDGGFDDRGAGLGRAGFLGSGLGAAANYLELTQSALRAQLAGGQTLAQVATAQGKTVDGLVSAMVAAQRKALTAAVSSGFLAQAQADRLSANLEATTRALVNGLRPRRGFDGDGGGFRGGPPGGGTFGGPGGSGNGGSSGGSGSFGGAATA